MRTDRAALQWMLHIDGAHERVGRCLLRLAEYDYVVQTQSGASHHTAHTMSHISTPARDDEAIPDAVPCLALPDSSAAWQLPPQTKGGLRSRLTLAKFLEGTAEDGRCKNAPSSMERSDESRFHEDANGLVVRAAPLEGAAHVYALTPMRYGVMMREQYSPQVGHPGASKMNTWVRR